MSLHFLHGHTILGLAPILSFAGLAPKADRQNLLNPEKIEMFTTITIGSHVSAQGPLLRHLPDGRATISTGGRSLTGWPVAQVRQAAEPRALSRRSFSEAGMFSTLTLAAALALSLAAGLWQPAHAESLLNVSYDPTRELYREVNEVFAKEWQAAGHPAPELQTSHGGSGAQARAVIEGLDAQVVTLALASDIDKIAAAGKLPADWQAARPHNSSPYTSTIVFLVRAGNPKGIKDWGDLVQDGVEVITPNPKTSGGARWNYLAAWAWAEKNGKDPKAFLGDLFKHVPVLDTGARGATTTFAQRGMGDVLLAWENEAYLALDELGADQFEIVVPSVSVLAEPPVALVEANIKSDDQRALANAYLDFLYTPEGQALAFKHYYRGWDASKADPADVARFPKLDLVTIDDLGGWAKVQPEHFGDGGIFDQIYTAK